MSEKKPPVDDLIKECERQEISCLYTSTTLYIWLRKKRLLRKIFIVAPIVLGTLATWSILDRPDKVCIQWMTATFAMLAGLFPAIYEVLNMDTDISDIQKQAAIYKNLQDKFRQLREISSKQPYDEFLRAFETIMPQI